MAKTRPTLLRLAGDGADQLFVLSVLVRYMPIKGTNNPAGLSVSSSWSFIFDDLDNDGARLAPVDYNICLGA